MPKPNVDIVTLVAVQELPPGVSVTKDWPMVVGDPATKTAYRIPVEMAGNIIAGIIGQAVNRPDRVYIPGVSMPAGSSVSPDRTQLIDPYLNGLEYSMHIRGVEYMVKGSEWQNDITGGGATLYGGFLFEDGQVVTVSFKPEISNILAAPDAVARFSNGVKVVVGDATASALDDRKLIVIQGATAAAPTYTLRADYPENVLCEIITGGGNNFQSIISPGTRNMFAGGTVSRIVLGQADFVKLVRVGNMWYVLDRGERWKHVGRPGFGGLPGPDMLAANRQSVLETDYPSLVDYVTALAADNASNVVSITAAGANPTKWARGGGVIMLPSYLGWSPRFLDQGAGKDVDRGTAGTANVIGSTQANQNKSHTHANGIHSQLLLKDGQGTAINTDNTATEPNLRTSATMLTEGGIEARPENVGLPALIHV